MNALKRTTVFAPRMIRFAPMSSKDQSHAGAINEAGGTFGKLEVAREAEYFYKKQLEQLAQLKAKDSVSAEEMLKKQIQEHEDALNRSKESLAKLKK
ncbi:ATPase inhibitor mai-2, mitochondrial [Pseudolycoriella hygida]|uniref:ATPase inhibitor mai-2, mitochondrial n=1 Tax=Pseudolycoriella hygida TaxID=35572 RepID=A0A9Q0N0W4_9DIPT|nr:ATPase inhibitor mai-2, mitochondrial [Pseudolycoriella hygida]